MSGDSKKKNPWRGDPPPPPIPGTGPRHGDTVELSAEEVQANLDFAVGPRRPPLMPVGASGENQEANAMVPLESMVPPSEPPALTGPPATAPVDDDAEHIQLKSRKEDSEMDMTPMVDIVFQLLIFFMVTAAFSLQKTKQFPTPKEDKPSTSAQPDVDNDGDFVVVMVDVNNTFRVQTPDWDEQAPSEQDLLIWLRRARDGATDGKTPTKMMVKANREASFEKVIVALDAGTAVGMEQIQLQTVDQDDE